MLHQCEEERQIALSDTPLVEREDVMALRGVDEEVRIFDTFGNALVGQQRADVVPGKEAA